MNKSGKIVGVYIDKNAPNEINHVNETFVKKCYDSGVQLITAADPQLVEEFLQKKHRNYIDTQCDFEN